jgi:hypothetical protein
MRIVTICRSSQRLDDAKADELMMALGQLAPEVQEKLIRLMDLLILSRGDDLVQRAITDAADLDEMIAILEFCRRVRSRLRGRRSATVGASPG